MLKRCSKLAAAFGVLAAVAMTMASFEASAGPTKCWRGTGGWYCY